METKTSEGLRGINWPTIEDYLNKKEAYKSSIKSSLLAKIDSDKFLRNINIKEKEFVADLLSDFMWGVDLTSKLFGYKGRVPDLDLSPDTRVKLAALYSPPLLRPRFIVNTEKIKKMIDLMSIGQEVHMQNPPYIRKLEPNEAFEITGVEEMAHHLFRENKGLLKTYWPLVLTGTTLEYHTKDVEERALIWKVAYTRHYFPHLYPQFKELLEDVQKLRTERLANKK
jgi:hypothetical protein